MNNNQNLVNVDWSQDYFYFFENFRKKDDVYLKNLGGIIKTRYEKRFQLVNSLENNKNPGTILGDKLKGKLDNLKTKEKELVDKMIGKDKVSYDSLNYKGKTYFWTNLINFGKIKTDGLINGVIEDSYSLPPKYCFRIIASSQEFSNKMRMIRGKSEISRSKFNSTETDKKKIEQEMMDAFKGINENTAIQNNKILKEITSSFYNQMGKNLSGKRNVGKQIKKIFTELNEKDIDYDKYHDELRNKLIEIANENDIKDTIYVTHKGGSSPYITISTKIVSNGAVYDKKDKNTSLKDAFYQAIPDVIQALKNEETKRFYLGGIGIVELLDTEEFFEKFYSNAIKFYKSNVKSIVNSLIIPEKIDYDSGIVGLIGEFIGKIGFRSVGEIKHTGATQDIVKVNNSKELQLGESFQDLLITNIGGINIKHYISKKANSITLYKPKEDDKGFNITSKYSYKYYSEKIASILRFLDLNFNIFTNEFKGTITKDNLENIYQNISILNLDSFIRGTAGFTEEQNILYQLNNIVVPTSVIYEKIIDLTDNINNFNNLFQISFNPSKYDTPKKEEVTQEYIDNHNLMNDYVFKKTSGSRVIFNGWKIDFSDLLKNI